MRAVTVWCRTFLSVKVHKTPFSATPGAHEVKNKGSAATCFHSFQWGIPPATGSRSGGVTLALTQLDTLLVLGRAKTQVQVKPEEILCSL